MCINWFVVGIPRASSFLSGKAGPTAGGLELDSECVCCWGMEGAVIPTAATLGPWVQGDDSASLAGLLVDVALFGGSTIVCSMFASI